MKAKKAIPISGHHLDAYKKMRDGEEVSKQVVAEKKESQDCPLSNPNSSFEDFARAANEADGIKD